MLDHVLLFEVSQEDHSLRVYLLSLIIYILQIQRCIKEKEIAIHRSTQDKLCYPYKPAHPFYIHER